MRPIGRATVMILWTLVAATTLAAAPKNPPTLKIGARAPDFTLPGVDGKNHSLADYADAQVLVIIFTCNHCPTAQAYEERIIKLTEDYRQRGVQVVAISANDPKAVRLDELGYTDVSDSLAEMKIRAKDRKFPFPYLYDGETQAASRKYGPAVTPHAYVFDKQRRLRFVGRIDNSEKPQRVTVRDTRNAIDDLLANRPVKVATTKVFGCSTKWASKNDTVKQALEKWSKEKVSIEPIDLKGIEKIAAGDEKKLRLVNLWATWCGPCIVELPEFVEMHRMYRRRDFELITICDDVPQQQAKALEFLSKIHASTNNYLSNSDDHFEMVEMLDPEWSGALPYTLLIAPGGKIVYRHQGPIDPLEVKKAVVKQLGRVYD